MGTNFTAATITLLTTILRQPGSAGGICQAWDGLPRGVRDDLDDFTTAYWDLKYGGFITPEEARHDLAMQIECGALDHHRTDLNIGMDGWPVEPHPSSRPSGLTPGGSCRTKVLIGDEGATGNAAAKPAKEYRILTNGMSEKEGKYFRFGASGGHGGEGYLRVQRDEATVFTDRKVAEKEMKRWSSGGSAGERWMNLSIEESDAGVAKVAAFAKPPADLANLRLVTQVATDNPQLHGHIGGAYVYPTSEMPKRATGVANAAKGYGAIVWAPVELVFPKPPQTLLEAAKALLKAFGSTEHPAWRGLEAAVTREEGK